MTHLRNSPSTDAPPIDSAARAPSAAALTMLAVHARHAARTALAAAWLASSACAFADDTASPAAASSPSAASHPAHDRDRHAAAGAVPVTPRPVDAAHDKPATTETTGTAAAPRLRVIVPTAFAYAVRDIAHSFTARTGMPVTVQVATAGNVADSLRERGHRGDAAPADAAPAESDADAHAGVPARTARHAPTTHAEQPFDIVLSTAADIAQMAGQGLIAPHGGTALPRVGIGMAVPAGRAIPDIHDAAALRRTLLSAHAVVFEDPAQGGPSGAYVVKLFDRLGIADRMKTRAKMVPAEAIRQALTHGHADLALEEATLLRDAPGMQYVGDLPPGMQYFTRYTGAITARSTHPTAARALLSFIAAGLAPQVQVDP